MGRLRAMAAPGALAATGAGLIAMTPATAAHAGPAVKPAPMAYIGSDGRIAFVRHGNLWVMNANGSKKRRITDAALAGSAVAWQRAPNATGRAFGSFLIYEGVPHIYSGTAAGGGNDALLLGSR